MRTALSIAGSDSSGGAGIQADIKTMTMHGVFAMTAVTALTAQNTTGVRSILESTPEFLGQQLDAVFEDIRPDAVKIGMVSSPALVRVLAESSRSIMRGMLWSTRSLLPPAAPPLRRTARRPFCGSFCFLWRRLSPRTFRRRKRFPA